MESRGRSGSSSGSLFILRIDFVPFQHPAPASRDSTGSHPCIPPHPHANLPSEACAMKKRSRPAEAQRQNERSPNPPSAPRPSPLAPARSGASACPPALCAVRASARTLAESANRDCPVLEIPATGSKISALQILIASQILFLPGLSLSDCRSRITTHNSRIMSFQIDSQNDLEMVLTLSKSIECNFEMDRLTAARVPSRLLQPGTTEAMSPPRLTALQRHCYSESSRSAATSNSRPLQFTARRTTLTEEHAWPPQ